MSTYIDKRLEILMGIILAYKEKHSKLYDDLDFVEFPDVVYAKELVSKIHIEKYPEINRFIEDKEFDCGYYTNLFVYFDDEMNFDNSYKISVFKTGTNIEFARIVKKIYDNENLEIIFSKYEEEFKKMVKSLNNITKIDLSAINNFYGVDEVQYIAILSPLLNGGFSSTKDNFLTYVRGLPYDGENYAFDKDSFIVCLFHEFSHPFINPLVDKYYDSFHNLDALYQDSITNGLPKTYQNKKTLLYEYFVRVNSIVLAKNYVSVQELNEYMKWFESIGFHYSREIIDLTEKNLHQFKNYEELFIHILIPYMNDKVAVKKY